MAQNRLFLDANVLMELFFDRKYCQQVLKELSKFKDGTVACVSILTVAIFFYYVEREKRSKQAAAAFLDNYEVLDMSLNDYQWANVNDQGDFEDALQVACALRHGCKKLLTLDNDMARNHKKHIATRLVS